MKTVLIYDSTGNILFTKATDVYDRYDVDYIVSE